MTPSISQQIGIANFAELDLQDSDAGAVLALTDGETLTFEGLEVVDLAEDNFILDA